VNRIHSKKATQKKPRAGCLPSAVECLGFYKSALLELVDRMTEDYDVLEAIAGEMFYLKNELDNTLKDLAETKSSMAESNRIFNHECTSM
jgi:hypothetical protein